MSRCGDGYADAALGEECDDGDTNSDDEPNRCRTTCTAPACGDGVRDALEGCDSPAESPQASCRACITFCVEGKANADLLPDNGCETDIQVLIEEGPQTYPQAMTAHDGFLYWVEYDVADGRSSIRTAPLDDLTQVVELFEEGDVYVSRLFVNARWIVYKAGSPTKARSFQIDGSVSEPVYIPSYTFPPRAIDNDSVFYFGGDSAAVARWNGADFEELWRSQDFGTVNQGVVVGGELFLADDDARTVSRIGADGVPQVLLENVSGVAAMVSSGAALTFVDGNGSLRQVDTTTGAARLLAGGLLAPISFRPVQLAVDAANRVWMATELVAQRAGVFEPETTAIVVFESGRVEGFVSLHAPSASLREEQYLLHVDGNDVFYRDVVNPNGGGTALLRALRHDSSP